MSLLTFLTPLLLLQVGPNPAQSDTLSTPDELLNRPARPQDAQDSLDAGSPEARWLGQCLELLETDPARAHTRAQIRRSESSGAMQIVANHCLGLAATELQLWDDATAAFEAARETTPAEEHRARARFGAMAGNAALQSGDAERALAILDTALAEAQAASSADLEAITQMDRARVLVTLDRSDGALASLEEATRLAPQSSEAWLLRATLLRRLEQLGDAQAAIEQAVALSPQNGAIGLEAGVIAILSGREEAARESWQSVIDIQPDSLAAQTAKGYLAQIAAAPNQQGEEQANP